MEFDIAVNEHIEAFNGGRKAQLEILLREINHYEYTSFDHVVTSIKNHLDLINEKAMTSEQYEAEANADHLTSEQF